MTDVTRVIHRPFNVLAAVAIVVVAGLVLVAPAAAQDGADQTIILRTARILDGTGDVLENRDVVVRDGRIIDIVAGGSGRGDRVYDLTALTVPARIHRHARAHQPPFRPGTTDCIRRRTSATPVTSRCTAPRTRIEP